MASLSLKRTKYCNNKEPILGRCLNQSKIDEINEYLQLVDWNNIDKLNEINDKWLYLKDNLLNIVFGSALQGNQIKKDVV